MANTTSAQKATRKIARRTEVNKARRSQLRSSVRKVEEAIVAGDRGKALAALKEAEPVIMRSAQKGVRPPQRGEPQGVPALPPDRQARRLTPALPPFNGASVAPGPAGRAFCLPDKKLRHADRDVFLNALVFGPLLRKCHGRPL